MSSFIVQDKTINSIVNFLEFEEMGNRHDFACRLLKDSGYNIGSRNDRERLAIEMFNLNVEATGQRYGEYQNETAFKYRAQIPPAEIQVFKNLQCWLYQCYEGTVDQHPLYKLMKQIKYCMAEGIVEGLPEYETAGWDE